MKEERKEIFHEYEVFYQKWIWDPLSQSVSITSALEKGVG